MQSPSGKCQQNVGSRCGTVSDNSINRCWSGSGIDDCIEVTASGGVDRRVKFSVKEARGWRRDALD
jgi:hypothetical protein